MTLSKEVTVDKIEWIESGHVQVREVTRIIEGGVVISQKHHRKVISPGDDYSAEEPRVQDACQIAHTPEVVAAYREKMQAQMEELQAKAEAAQAVRDPVMDDEE